MAVNFEKKTRGLPPKSGVTITYNSYDSSLPDNLILNTKKSRFIIMEGDDYNDSLNKARKISIELYDLLKH